MDLLNVMWAFFMTIEYMYMRGGRGTETTPNSVKAVKGLIRPYAKIFLIYVVICPVQSHK
jgi:hypothetical protein